MPRKKADPGLDALDAVKRSIQPDKPSRARAKAKADDDEPKPRARKTAAAKPKGARARKPKGGKARGAPVSWRRWLITEAVVWGLGATAGLVATGGLLWSQISS